MQWFAKRGYPQDFKNSEMKELKKTLFAQTFCLIKLLANLHPSDQHTKKFPLFQTLL